jgi:hypothetical protein
MVGSDSILQRLDPLPGREKKEIEAKRQSATWTGEGGHVYPFVLLLYPFVLTNDLAQADQSELGLIEKLSNQSSLFLVFDPREEFGAEARDRLRLIKRHLVVNLAALEVTRLAARLEDWLDFRIEVRLFRSRKR